MSVDPRWSGARRVLVSRLDNLGDILLATPAIHAIREGLPGAHITLHASPSGAQVAKLNPDVDDVVVYQAPWMDPEQTLPQDPAREQDMIERLRAGRYDGAIIFTSYHESPLPTAYLYYLAGIPLRHAASIDGPGSLLTTRHRHPDGLVHEVERGLDLVGGLGFQTEQKDLVLRLRPGDREAVEDRLRSLGVRRDRPLVAIHAGSTCPARTYPWEQYSEAADLLVERLGAAVVLTGSAGEVELVERIRGAMRHSALSLAGQTTVSELAALVAASEVLITNNTGPMHVAAALKTPVVVLFALTNPPEQWGPWAVPHRMLYHPTPCAICYKRRCPVDHACLRKVTPEQVAQAAAELLMGVGGWGSGMPQEVARAVVGGRESPDTGRTSPDADRQPACDSQRPVPDRRSVPNCRPVTDPRSPAPNPQPLAPGSPGQVRSILFVELLGGIGDLLMALPAIHALRRSHPESRVSVLTFPPGGELLEMDPEVAEVLYTRRGPDVGEAGSPAKRDLAKLLAERRFDLVVSDTRYSRIHELIESSAAGRNVTHLWLGASPDEPIERLFPRRLVEEGAIEARFTDLPMRLPIGPEERARADEWWSATGLPRGEAVVLNPHSGMPIKRWPLEHFVALARALRRSGRPVAVLAGEQPALAEEVARAVDDTVVVPHVPLRRLAGLLASLGAFVSADTGPAKVAAAVGTPVVGIFGPTWAGRYGQLPPSVSLQSPFDCPELNRLNFTVQPCWYSGKCVFAEKVNCCEDVRPERVLEAVEAVLAGRRTGDTNE